MRIAIVGPTYPYKGGIAAHTTELSHRLGRAGHEVVLESWSRQYPALMYPGQQTIDAPEYELFPDSRRTLSWRRPDSWWRLGRRLRSWADLVVLAVSTPVQVVPYLGILAGLRGGRAQTVALCHNVLPHERRRLDERLIPALLGRVDAVLVHSVEELAVARALTDRPVRAAAMAPHGPVVGAAAVASADPSADPTAVTVRRQLLFFGIVRPYKGLDVLLRALARAPADVRLTVAGEFWGGSAATERLIGELGLAERVTLRPGYLPTEQIPALFAGADALVLPYRTATSSQNAWIAFKHGVPVISTRAGSLGDQVVDGVDGILCDPDDVDSLAAALARFYQPGMPERLRAGVAPVDPEPYWKSYVERLTATVAARPGRS